MKRWNFFPEPHIDGERTLTADAILRLPYRSCPRLAVGGIETANGLANMFAPPAPPTAAEGAFSVVLYEGTTPVWVAKPVEFHSVWDKRRRWIR